MFDLLTALLNSWSLWNQVAGSEEVGFDWRARYLQLTYDAGPYRSYEGIIKEAAQEVGVSEAGSSWWCGDTEGALLRFDALPPPASFAALLIEAEVA